MYLTYVSEREYVNAVECSKAARDILSEIYGPRAKRIASKHYQIANSQLTLQNREQAIESIKLAI